MRRRIALPPALLSCAVAAASLLAQQQTQRHGTVVASSDGRTTHAQTPSADAPQAQAADEDRRALTFTRYAFDVRLQPREHGVAVRASMTVRNDGARPLSVLPLQISSTLAWSSIHIGGTAAQFAQNTVESDADHTGKLNEAVVRLATPLAPKSELTVDALYTGAIPPDATRLLRIGTPPDVAAHSDWDGVSSDFIGLRGFGNVVWYPVASAPVRLGDGDALFSEIGLTKMRESAAMVSMTVTEEVYGAPPTVALLDGQPVPLSTVVASHDPGLPSIVVCTLPASRLGFATPSLFLAARSEQTGNDLRIFSRADDAAAPEGYMTAASMVAPEMKEWLGARPRSPLAILDLPSVDDGPFEQGQAFYAGLQNVDPKRLTPMLSHVLAHAYFTSPRPWLNEGVAHFMATLWTERSQGREAAIAELDNQRPALALAEPNNPDTDPGQSLMAAHDGVYYRTKAAYVLWMLRGIVGDEPLAAALRAYDPAQDTTDAYFQTLLERTSGKALDWFFNDWVYRDRGLPDLSIEGVYPSQAAGADTYIVSVTVANSGYAAADVPVTVSSLGAVVTERVLAPARGRVAHRFLLQGRPVTVQVNDGATPEVQASVHRTEVHSTTAGE